MLSVVVGCHEACEEKEEEGELFKLFRAYSTFLYSYCTKIYAKWLGSNMLAFLGYFQRLASSVCTNLRNALR